MKRSGNFNQRDHPLNDDQPAPRRDNVLTGLAAIAGVFGLYILYGTLEATNRQLELSERPWVSVSPITISDLTFDKNGNAHFGIRFAIKNHGHSPSAHTFLDGRLIPIKPDADIFTEPLDMQRQLCGALKSARVGNDFATFTLFPDEPTTRDLDMTASPTDIKAAESTS